MLTIFRKLYNKISQSHFRRLVLMLMFLATVFVQAHWKTNRDGTLATEVTANYSETGEGYHSPVNKDIDK